MATPKGLFLVKSFNIRTLNFSTSCYVNNKWRRANGLEPDPRRFGPLTNLPDYSFVDGRPTPLGHLKKAKLELQMGFCKKIAELSHEIDVGMEEYQKKVKEKREQREATIKNKLKPKGAALLKDRNHSET